jgi:hypothetical protein
LRDGQVDFEIQCPGRVGVTAFGVHQDPFDNELLQRADLGVKAASRSGLRSPRGGEVFGQVLQLDRLRIAEEQCAMSPCNPGERGGTPLVPFSILPKR